MGKELVKLTENFSKDNIARIKRWLKKTGDIIEINDPILLIEFEEKEVFIKSEVSGELTEQKLQEGETIKIGDVFAEIENDDEDDDDDDDDTNTNEGNRGNNSIRVESSNQLAESLSYLKTNLVVISVFKSGLFYFIIVLASILIFLFVSEKYDNEKKINKEKKKYILEEKSNSSHNEEMKIKSTPVKEIEEKKDSISENLKTAKKTKSKQINQVVKPKKAKKENSIAEIPFQLVDEVPIFPGCEKISKSESRYCFQEQINKHIRQNFRYPEIAQKQGIQGRVYVNFIIYEKGEVKNIRIRGPNINLEKEALRIISLLPVMTPAKHKGIIVRVPFSIPITFRLS